MSNHKKYKAVKITIMNEGTTLSQQLNLTIEEFHTYPLEDKTGNIASITLTVRLEGGDYHRVYTNH